MNQNKAQKIFLLAGEPSGDLHGAHLAKKLKDLLPGCILEGVCGPRMQEEGVKTLLRVEDFSVMGFSDVFKALPKLYRSFHFLLQDLLSKQPEAIIFIDYPGFNLRMAKALRKKGFKGKLIHYISPSVWAWKRYRIRQMAKSLDLLLTIFPFEKKHFQDTSLKVKYVGNPLKDYIEAYPYQPLWEGLKLGEKKFIALFPGSRKGEIHKNLPLQLGAIETLAKTGTEFSFAISVASPEIKETIEEYVKQYPALVSSKNLFLVPSKYNYELMKGAHAALAKSGTVTLELALHRTPTIVMYKTSFLNRLIAKHIFRLNLPYYCIVNLILEKEVFPEFIAQKYDSNHLYQSLKTICEDWQARQSCLSHCESLRHVLQPHHSSLRAAEAVVELL